MEVERTVRVFQGIFCPHKYTQFNLFAYLALANLVSHSSILVLSYCPRTHTRNTHVHTSATRKGGWLRSYLSVLHTSLGLLNGQTLEWEPTMD